MAGYMPLRVCEMLPKLDEAVGITYINFTSFPCMLNVLFYHEFQYFSNLTASFISGLLNDTYIYLRCPS